MSFGGDHLAHSHGDVSLRCIPGLPDMARYRSDAFPCRRPWQDCALMRSQAAGRGKISPRCVPEGASDGKSTGSWQHIACMYSDSASFGKICVACIRKAPQRAVGECTARASCRQGAFSPSEALRSCTAHESCHPLMALPLRRDDLPYGPCSRTLLNACPLRRDAHPSAPPIPVTRRTPPTSHKRNEDANSQNDFGQQAIDPSRKSRMEAVKNRMRESRVEPCRREQRRVQQHSTGCNAAIPARMP